MADQNDRLQWETEDEYWSTNYRSRPYASSGARQYDSTSPATATATRPRIAIRTANGMTSRATSKGTGTAISIEECQLGSR